jgi:glioma pathogenesis-related protein 2
MKIHSEVAMKKLIIFILITGFACTILADNSTFENEILKRHNQYRKKHGVAKLEWNDSIASYAQQWAHTLARENRMRHRGQRKYGENIYWRSGGSVNGKMPVDSWYREIKDYNFKRQGFSSRTGHFTQVVWKNTTEIGCGKSVSSSGGIFVVCNYNPPGNFMGRFEKNVLPLER